jgi:hypothetical protein
VGRPKPYGMNHAAGCRVAVAQKRAASGAQSTQSIKGWGVAPGGSGTTPRYCGFSPAQTERECPCRGLPSAISGRGRSSL